MLTIPTVKTFTIEHKMLRYLLIYYKISLDNTYIYKDIQSAKIILVHRKSKIFMVLFFLQYWTFLYNFMYVIKFIVLNFLCFFWCQFFASFLVVLFCFSFKYCDSCCSFLISFRGNSGKFTLHFAITFKRNNLWENDTEKEWAIGKTVILISNWCCNKSILHFGCTNIIFTYFTSNYWDITWCMYWFKQSTVNQWLDL